MSNTTLATEYAATNVGSEKITDVTAALSGEAAEYARISPTIENYELDTGGQVTFKVVPDLSKMKENGKSKIEGTLKVSGGRSASAPIVFDTQGQEITSTTMGELALIQDGNPYADLEFEEDTLSFTTSARGETQDFNAITKRYYDENDAAKNGIDTVDEYKEVVRTLIDEDGLIDFTIDDTVKYGDGQSGAMSVSVSAEFIEEGAVQPQNLKAQGNSTSNRVVLCSNETGSASIWTDVQGDLYIETTANVSFDDYMEVLEKVNKVASHLNIEGIDDLMLDVYELAGIKNENPAGKVLLKTVNKLQGAVLKFPSEFSSTNLEAWLYDAHMKEASANYYNFATSSISKASRYSKFTKGLGDATKYISTGIDIYKTGKVWSNPKATTGQKIGYASLQTVRAANRFWGGKALAKGGAWLGAAVGDGPGAIVGFFAGYVVSGLIDLGLNEWAKSIEDELDAEDGMALYYDIYGHQCTNVGKVSSDFYLPDYTSGYAGGGGGGGWSGWGSDSDEPDDDAVDYPRIYETGRMYDGTNGNNFYVDATKVGYDYYINDGESVARSTNNGLTQVTMVDLSRGKDNLVSGRNTIVRDYDTNPGTHYVTADSEITVIYPIDTVVSYIGKPSEMEEVRRLPDFAVYRENIAADGDLVKGESGKISTYVYNRGSLGGWVDIAITDGTTTLASEENVYMGAFSERKIEFDWTPTAIGNASISVQLTNKSLMTSERKTDNNSASHTFSVREREVPEIVSISPEVGYVDEVGSLCFSADIAKIADLKDGETKLFVDGTELEGASLARMGGSNGAIAQLSAYARGLTAGNHAIKAVAAYTTASGTATVEKTVDFEVKEHTKLSVSVDATIANPVFYAVEKGSGDSHRLAAVAGTASDGETVYAIAEDSAIEGHESLYALMVRADEGLLVTDMDKAAERVLSLDGGRTITVNGNEGIAYRQMSLYNAVLGSVGEEEEDVSIYDVNLGTYSAASIKVVGLKQISTSVYYRAGDLSGSVWCSGITFNQDTSIDLADLVRVYRINVASDGDDSNSRLNMFMAVDGQSWWGYEEYGYDSETRAYTILVDGREAIQELEDAEDVSVFLYSYGGSVIRRVSLKEYTSPVTASKAANRSVNFVLDPADASSDTLQDVQASLLFEGRRITLRGTALSVPPGEYDASIRYTIGGQIYYVDKRIDVTSADASVMLEVEKRDMAKLAVSWPESLGLNYYANVSCSYSDDNGYKSYDYSVENGRSIDMPAGECSINLILSGSSDEDYRYVCLNAQATLEKDKTYTFDVGTSYDGKLHLNSSSVVPKGNCWASLSDLDDGRGVVLNSIDLEMPLVCEAVFTDVLDASKTYKSEFKITYFSTDGSLRIPVPDAIPEGEYRCSVSLALDVQDAETVVAVTGVSLDKETLTLDKGATARLIASVEPINAANKTISWTSDDSAVATVDETGNVTAVGVGSTVVTATTVDGGFQASCNVTVRADSPEQSDGPGAPDGPNQPDGPGTTDGPGAPDTPTQPDRPGAPDTSTQPDTPEQPEQPEQPEPRSDAALTGVTLSKTRFVHNGKTQVVSVALVKAGSRIVPSNAYTVSGASGKAAGAYTVTVTAKEGSGYTGTATADFQIVRAKSVVSAKKALSKKAVDKKALTVLKVSTPALAKNIIISKQPTAKSLRKYIKVSAGKKTIKLAKGAKRGTYKVRVTVRGGNGLTYTNLKKTYVIKVI